MHFAFFQGLGGNQCFQADLWGKEVAQSCNVYIPLETVCVQSRIANNDDLPGPCAETKERTAKQSRNKTWEIYFAVALLHGMVQ